MAHVLIVGAGGNIGSHLTPLLARARGVTRLTLIDRDRYEPSNVSGQAIEPRDVGRPKARVQARRARRLNPALAVDALHAAVEDVPLGRLRAHAIVACLDSRAARVTVNQAAWRLGVPWIDGGVDGAAWLARVRLFVPSPDAACLECGWDQADYDAVDQEYPCGGASVPAPTNAPAALGALTAALQAIECLKVLGGQTAGALVGRELLMDVDHHRHFVTSFRRNPECRMPDHAGWRIERLARPVGKLTVGDTFILDSTTSDTGHDGAERRLDVAGQRIATAIRCGQCNASVPVWRLERALRRGNRRCRHCGHQVRAAGFDLDDGLSRGAAPHRVQQWPLSRLGVLPGDVVTLSGPASETHYEIGGAS